VGAVEGGLARPRGPSFCCSFLFQADHCLKIIEEQTLRYPPFHLYSLHPGGCFLGVFLFFDELYATSTVGTSVS
jgi:hypothetical protein